MYVKNLGRKLGEEHRLKIIEDLFIKRYKINLERIKKSDIKKTPDFEYIKDGRRIFVMELKTLEWLSKEEKEKKGYRKDETGCLTKISKNDKNLNKVAW